MDSGWKYMRNILNKLKDIAGELDDTEWYDFADELDSFMKRLEERTIGSESKFRQGNPNQGS